MHVLLDRVDDRPALPRRPRQRHLQPRGGSTGAFLASAPHALDILSVRRLNAAASWLQRAAASDNTSPFTTQQLVQGRVPLLVHPYVIADAHLLAAVVGQYLEWLGPTGDLPGLVVVLPRLRRVDGAAVQQAAQLLSAHPLVLAHDVEVSLAGPGLPDFAHVGARHCPTTLVAVSRADRPAEGGPTGC